MNNQYERLASFLGAWFHQDFDISGNTVDEIVADYKASATKEDIENLRRDIQAFLKAHPNDASDKLEETFDLEIDPFGFAPSGEMFLRAINEALSD
jgi:CdiI immunity protein